MAEDLIQITGMVIQAIPVGDYDKRITILSREMGKVQVFVQGAKRPKSMFVAAANPFVYGNFELRAGKNYNLAKVSVGNYFEKLQQDLDAVCYGSYFLELASYFANEGEESEELLKLLYSSILALTKTQYDKRLVRRIFEWKALQLNGEAPDLFSCRICSRKENLIYFSTSREGCVCAYCQRPLGSLSVNETCLYALQYIVVTPVTKLFSFSLAEEALKQLENVVSDYFYVHVDRDFKSLEMLKNLS